MARFQISFTTGMAIHPPKEFEGSYPEAKKFVEAELEHYLCGTRYHIQVWPKTNSTAKRAALTFSERRQSVNAGRAIAVSVISA